MPRTLKPATTLEDQLTLLESRGMEVDRLLARQWLSNVSYYRLSAYWYPARQLGASGHRENTFAPGTKFSDVVALYECDRKLRTLIHDGMERIEIALRARIGEEIYAHGGPLAYRDAAIFRPAFRHSDWLKTAQKRIQRARKYNESIRHYEREYKDFPFWVLAEVLDFADISKLLEGLIVRQQRSVAEGLGIVIDLSKLTRNEAERVKKESPLVRWTEQLTIVRNTCAHHARVWNRSFVPAPTAGLRTQSEFQRLPEGQSERIFGALTVMAHLLRTTSPGTTWPQKITTLISTSFLANPLVKPEALGIPINWNGEL